MKNIKQTISWPLYVVMPEVCPKDLRKQVAELAVLASRGDPSTEEKSKLLYEMLPDKTRDVIKSFGVTYPYEKVDVTLEAGQLLLDIYVCGMAKPESPIEKRATEKRLGDLSERFTRDDIEIPDYARETIRRVLADGGEWKKANGHVHVLVEGQKRFFMISSAGLDYYTNVLNALVDELGDL